MFCTNCGASNKDDALSCINCGESLSDDQIEESFLSPRRFRGVSIQKKVGLLRALFNLSFNQWVSLRLVKFLYGLSILSAGLIAIFFVMMGFKISIWFGIFSLLIGAPLTFLLIVIYSRIFLETILVIFRMADHMNETTMTNREEKSESSDTIQWNV
jgi:hypothetical protein